MLLSKSKYTHTHTLYVPGRLPLHWGVQRLTTHGGGLVAKFCPTLVTPWTVARQGPLYRGFLARILEWVAISFSRGSSRPRDQLLVSCIAGFPDSLAGKESTCNTGDLGLIPGLGRCPGEGNSYAFQYSGLEKSMDCIVHGVTKSQTRVSDFHFHFFFTD